MRRMYPIGSMYGIFTYIWFISMVNVGKLPYMDPVGMDEKIHEVKKTPHEQYKVGPEPIVIN